MLCGNIDKKIIFILILKKTIYITNKRIKADKIPLKNNVNIIAAILTRMFCFFQKQKKIKILKEFFKTLKMIYK